MDILLRAITSLQQQVGNDPSRTTVLTAVLAIPVAVFLAYQTARWAIDTVKLLVMIVVSLAALSYVWLGPQATVDTARRVQTIGGAVWDAAQRAMPA
jgi:hypothetical protein